MGHEAIKHVAQKFHQLLRKYNKTKRAISQKHIQKKTQNARRQCTSNFWKFASQVLDEESEQKHVMPNFSADAAEAVFTEMYSSSSREYQATGVTANCSPPQQNFNEEPISAAEIQFAITKSRTCSSPSPIDRIPYLIFKCCPSLALALTDLFDCCCRDGVLPSGWKKGVIHLIPKASAVEKPQDPSNFRPIALTSCVGKLFTFILKIRWLTYRFLDTSVQKAFLPGTPGCLEQYQNLAAVIQQSHKCHRSPVCVLARHGQRIR